MGYKVHLTESSEAHLPLIITHVETTAAPVSDDAMIATIHAKLDHKHLLPAEHIVDTGYVDAKLLVESQRDYQVDPGRVQRVGTINGKPGSKLASMLTTFSSIGNSNRRSERQGHTSSSWTPAIDNRKNEVINTRVLDEGLPGLPISIAVYPINSPYPPDRDDSSTGAVSGLDAEA